MYLLLFWPLLVVIYFIYFPSFSKLILLWGPTAQHIVINLRRFDITLLTNPYRIAIWFVMICAWENNPSVKYTCLLKTCWLEILHKFSFTIYHYFLFLLPSLRKWKCSFWHKVRSFYFSCFLLHGVPSVFKVNVNKAVNSNV